LWVSGRIIMPGRKMLNNRKTPSSRKDEKGENARDTTLIRSIRSHRILCGNFRKSQACRLILFGALTGARAETTRIDLRYVHFRSPRRLSTHFYRGSLAAVYRTSLSARSVCLLLLIIVSL
jgi:hypothetical protein